MQGFAQLHRPTLAVRLAYDAKPTADRTEYQRVTLRREGRELVAETTGSQSSSRLMSLAGAHALGRGPAGEQGLQAGSGVGGVSPRGSPAPPARGPPPPAAPPPPNGV